MQKIDESIFFEDDEPRSEDIKLFESEPKAFESPAEQKFWKEMKKKVLGEFAPSGDLLMSEHFNEDLIYLVRYYFHEFRIGKGLVNNRTRGSIYVDSFTEAINADLYPLLDRHILLIEWLREIDFKGIDYEGNYALH